MRTFTLSAGFVFLVAFFALFSSFSSAANISACGNVNAAGTYVLTTNLYVGQQTCLNVSAHDVQIDCQGFYISSNRTGTGEVDNAGIRIAPQGGISTPDNVTVINCRVLNFTVGIYIVGSSNVTVRNSTIYNNSFTGIYVGGGGVFTNSTFIYNNTISYNTQYGIHAPPVNSSAFYNNLLYNQSGYNIYLQSGLDNNLTNNTILNSTQLGIRVDGSENRTLISDNRIYNLSSSGGVNVVGATGAWVRNNTIYNITGQGITFQAGIYNNASNNTISNCTQAAIRADSSENFTRIESNVLYNNAGGVALITSLNATVRNNTITFGSGDPVTMQTFTRNTTVANNTIINFTAAGIVAVDHSDYNLIFNNSLVNGSFDGITLGGSFASNNTVFYNNVSFIYGSATGISVGNASYNNVTDNRIINVTGTGLSLATYSYWDRVSNNVIANVTSGNGITLSGRSQNNTVFMNNVSSLTTGFNAISISDSSYNNVSSNRVTNGTGSLISLSGWAFGNTVADNVLFNASDGGAYAIYVFNGSAYNSILRNIVNFTPYGIMVSTNSTYVTVANNTLARITNNVIRVETQSNNATVADNSIFNNSVNGQYGIVVSNSSFCSILRNTVNSTYGHIQLTLSALNNTVSSNDLRFTSSISYSVLVESSSQNNTVFNNTITNHSYEGIRIDTFSQLNYVQNNTIVNGTFDQGRGITVTGDSKFNFIDYNNVSFGYGHISLSNASNNTVRFNQLTNDSIQNSPIRLDTYSQYNVIAGNLIQNASYRGLVITNSSYNRVENNTLLSINFVEIFTNATNNTFANNFINVTSDKGIHLYGNSYNNSFVNTTILNPNFVGVYLQNDARDTFFENTTLGGVIDDAVRIDNSNQSVFRNGRFSASSAQTNYLIAVQNASSNHSFFNITLVANAYFVRLNQSSSAFFQNSTYDQPQTNVADAFSNLTVYWTDSPVISLSSPSNGVTLSGTPTFQFSYAHPYALTASCNMTVDGSFVAANAVVANNTLTSLTSNTSISAAPHQWRVQCDDGINRRGNSSVWEFSISSGGSSQATPVPTASPSPTPVPTPVPTAVPSVLPSVLPSVEPSSIPGPTVQPAAVETVVAQPQAGSGPDSAAPAQVVVTKTLTVERTPTLSGGSSVSSLVTIHLDAGTATLSQITEHFPFIEYLGPDPAAYERVGIHFNPRPVRIEKGSAVVTWLFDNAPSSADVSVKVDNKEITKAQVAQTTTPKIIARAASASGSAAASASAAAAQSAKPAGFDWLLPAVGLLVVLGVAGFFLTRRKADGM